MGGRFVLAATVAACGSGATQAPPTPAPAPVAVELEAAGETPCTPDADRRYALVGSLYTRIENVTRDDFAAAWAAGKIAATAETRAMLALDGGVELEAGKRPDLAPERWAIVPAHELVPAYRVITIDGQHPLDDTYDALVGKQCGEPNIDPRKVTTIAMTGTSALTRFVAALMDKRGSTYPARDVEPWLRTADFVHVSHEVSIVPECPADKAVKGLLMCAPAIAIEALEASHANVIELTGSHLGDFGKKYIGHTIDLYAERGWVWFGGGRDQVEAAAPRIVEHGGNRIAFVGCNMPHTTSKYIVEGPGVAACDLERLRHDIADLRRRGIVPIVSIQHQEVYDHEPPYSTVRDFRKLAEAGAAVVFGSQAHVPHPWDVHHGAYVHYGAGNFLFDQQFELTRDGVHDKLYIHDGRLLSVGQLFTRIEEWGRPRPMSPAERARLIGKLQEVRKELPAARPWAAPQEVDLRERVDSFLVGKELQRVVVIAPAGIAETASIVAGAHHVRYPLVIDLVGDVVDESAFVARVKSKARGISSLASTYLQARYPIDPDRITVRSKSSRR